MAQKLANDEIKLLEEQLELLEKEMFRLKLTVSAVKSHIQLEKLKGIVRDNDKTN